MKVFECQVCGQLLHFENVRCLSCDHPLGYLPDRTTIAALALADDAHWTPAPITAAGARYRMCANYRHQDVCNWMVPADDPDPFCLACRLNETIPDLSVPGNRMLWARLERSKRHALYSILRLGLPLEGKSIDPEQGLAFAFLADPDPSFVETVQVLTGHAQGLITINLAEADDAVRERRRQHMGEPYRTVLGHFRHELGHYYWRRLIPDSGRLSAFRELFGDERADYGQALQHHNAAGPPRSWQTDYVSGYASAHPWEDWAETWAHYLHMVDTLETAGAFGLSAQNPVRRARPMIGHPLLDPYDTSDLQGLIAQWLSLAEVMNALNRSMGQPDPWPFVLSPNAIAKLGFIHAVIHEEGEATAQAP
jgi:hypothetical protein